MSRYKGSIQRTRKRLMSVMKRLSSEKLNESESLRLEGVRDTLTAELDTLLKLSKGEV